MVSVMYDSHIEECTTWHGEFGWWWNDGSSIIFTLVNDTRLRKNSQLASSILYLSILSTLESHHTIDSPSRSAVRYKEESANVFEAS